MMTMRNEFRFRAASRALTGTLSFAVLLSCGGVDDPVVPSFGSLTLNATGLSQDARPDFTVVGPSGTFVVNESDTTLGRLQPGAYTVLTPTVWGAVGRFEPDAHTRTVLVEAGKSISITVSYDVWQSRIALTISGLPSSAGANVVVTGPGFSTTATQSQTIGDLKAGTYSVAANDVSFGGVTYRGTPLAQSVTLPQSAVAVAVSVTYAAVAAPLAVARVVSRQ